jgi:tetratricopeptide (TPR) repeat protein
MQGAWRISLVAALLAAAVARAAPVHVEGIASEAVGQGLAAYDELDYARAVERLQTALAREALTRIEKSTALRVLGFAHVALDDLPAAREDFERLLALDPDVALDRTISPRIRKVFEEARARVATGQARPPTSGALPQLTPSLDPARPRAGRPLEVRVAWPGGVAAKVALYHRLRGEALYSTVTASEQGGHFALEVSGAEVQAPGVEYYLVALDEAGAPIAGAGSLGAPLSVEVAGRPRPVWKRGWLWGLLGGLVAAGAASGIVAWELTRPGPNDPATVTILPR